MSHTYIWPVSGMTCASCERLVGAALKKMPGVEEVDVSVKKGKAGVRMAHGAPQPDLASVNAELATHGYHVGKNPPAIVCKIPGRVLPIQRRIAEAFGMVLLVGIAMRFLFQPLSQIVPSVSASSSLAALFALGLVASVSTCLASVGAFLLAYTAESTSKATSVRIQVGRLIAFAVGGGALGAIGGTIPTGSLGYGVVGLALGLGFALVGLHLMDLSPSLAAMGLKLPSFFGRAADRLAERKGGVASFVVGAATFILPCGFTQTAQALALSSGSALQGALMMTAFALGTLPVLFGITAFGSLAAFKNRALKLAAGAFLFFFAFGQIDGGLTVLGSPMTFGGFANRVFQGTAELASATPANAQEQSVSMEVGYGRFSPDRFTIKKGVLVRWEVKGVDISGCASTLISPKLGVSQSLALGMNVIQFTAKESGVIPFSCGMGMIRGSFNVVD